MAVGETDVRPATPAQLDEVVHTLHAAFLDDPLMRWLFPDPQAQLRLQPRLIRHAAERTFADGEVLTAGDTTAVSLWRTVQPGGAQQPPDADDQQARAAFGDYVERLATLGSVLHPYAPEREPYLYLWFLGALPESRGTGLGGTLLRHRLARADSDGLGSFLEASSPRNRVLYERHGFVAMGEPAVLPADEHAPEVPIQPMWRAPR